MPELAEIEFFRRQWSSALGEKVLGVALHERVRNFRNGHPRALRRALPGAVLRSAEAHGKQLLFGFSQEIWLSAHLGMTGRLLQAEANYVPQRHDHLILFFPDRSLVYHDPRQFGRIRFQSSPDHPVWWQQLPPSIESEGFTPQLLGQVLDRHSKSPLKALLLDQTSFPGIGNWMADEVLWRTRVHPRTPAGQLGPEKAVQLWNQLREVCQEALRIIGQNGEDPPSTWLFPHRWRNGNSCPACHAPLSREEIRGRTACWCPRCQPP